MTTDAGPDAHYAKNTDNVSFTTVLLTLSLSREVKHQVEAYSIGVIECLGGKILTCGRKEDPHFGELLIYGLLYVIVVCVTTDAASLESDCFL